MRSLPITAVISTVIHVALAAAWLAHDDTARAPRPVAITPQVAEPELEVVLVELPPSPGSARISSSSRSPSRTRGAPSTEAARTREPVPEVAPPAVGPGATLAMRGRAEIPTLPQGVIDGLVEKAPAPDRPGNGGELVRQRDGSYRTEKDTFIARVDPDGKVHLKDKPNLEVHVSPFGIWGRFDLTDWAMRSRGMDPYASEKLRFLDRTRDQRVAIGQEYRRAQLAQSGLWMQRNIDRLWASTTELAARKQGLFELWDDCAETGDAALVDGGAAARWQVESFIQVKLRGSDAFTADELAQFNAVRRSTASFAPYESVTTRASLR